jgi:hypothetical protein
MTHLDDDALVLAHYGEEDGPENRLHLAACADCKARLVALGDLLGTVQAPEAPERPADYGARVWARLEPRLQAKPAAPLVFRVFGARPLPKVAGFSALAASLVLAFLLGRQFPGSAPQALTPAVRERILLVAIGDHLERSQMVLVEIANAPSDGPLDVSAERASASDLVAANRLYRQTAARSGEPALAAVLEELERVLVEVAAGPEQLSQADLGELQRRIEARGLLFKIRVVGSQVREREKAKPPSPARVS